MTGVTSSRERTTDRGFTMPRSLLALAERLRSKTFSADAAAPLANRNFLIVTAPFGPFAKALAEELRSQGGEVSRMLFNGGDVASWGFGRGGIHFPAPASDWPAAFDRMVGDYTDVILFGESGPYNQAALAGAKRREARTWVLENGYFRPNWITVERNGVNWNGSLPRHRSAYDVSEPLPPSDPVGRILPHHVWNIALHHVMQLPGRFLFPNYRFSYPTSPWRQGFAHVYKYVTLRLRRIFMRPTTPKHMSRPYYLACLQRDGDSQLLRHSDFPTNVAFMDHLVANFAAFAPPNTHLAIKNHPLDCGLVNLGKAARDAAVRHGVAGRVTFIEDGHLAELCRAALGLVVNNSTAGLAALEFGTPVKVLGRAFFDFEGLTDQKPLSEFWRQPERPDAGLVERFRQGAILGAQINGSFHAPGSVRPTARRLIAHFSRADAQVDSRLAEGNLPADLAAQRQATQ